MTKHITQMPPVLLLKSGELLYLNQDDIDARKCHRKTCHCEPEETNQFLIEQQRVVEMVLALKRNSTEKTK